MAQSLRSLRTLHEAAEEGDRAAIERLIEEGADVNARDQEQRTPLHLAAGQAAAATIDLLVSRGADPFATDARGWTPLHCAAAFYPFNAVATLVPHMRGQCTCLEQQHPMDPSKVNAADPFGRTPLQLSDFGIGPFLRSCEGHAEAAPFPWCVNVVDEEGSAEVICPDGHMLRKVLQLPFDVRHLQRMEEENKEHHALSRRQTHLLQQLLSKHLYYMDDDPIVRGLQDFVFGSKTKGGAICSFTCNHHPHHLQEMKAILGLKGHPEDLCQRLMDSSMGRCDSKESISVTVDVVFFLNALSAFFHDQCPMLQFKRIQVGSSAEGTKVGRPDEFDVLLCLTQLSEGIQEVDYKGWIFWSAWLEARLEAELATYSPDKKNITRGTRVKLFQLLADFVAQSSSWGALSFRCLKRFSCGYNIILWHEQRQVHVKIDLVPSVSCWGKWYVFQEVPYFNLRHVDGVTESFAERELAEMKSLPPKAREGYMLAKSLRDVHLLSHVLNKPLLSDLVDYCLPSHVLKHALFHAYEREKHLHLDLASIQPLQWARSIYHLLSTEDFLPNFFSDSNILDTNPYPYERQEHLNHFLQRRNLPAFDPEMEVKEYRKHIMDAILEMLDE